MSNGDIYIGEWSMDLKNGKGEYRFSDGDKYEGYWIDNHR